jgi:hypothetical protein
MGVQKTSPKTSKKPSKLSSLKNLVFGSSGGSSKKSSPSAPKKESPVGKTTEASQKIKTQPAGSAKSTVKNKGSESENSKSKPVNLKKAASKGTSFKGLGRGSVASEGVVETVCREVACEGLATSGGYCRLHYIKNWKKIKRKEAILHEKKLDQYIEELVAKYPDKYIEAIRQDLANDKDFAKVIHDLDLDEGADDFDVEGGESMDSLIDTIKRDFDDDGDAF